MIVDTISVVFSRPVVLQCNRIERMRRPVVLHCNSRPVVLYLLFLADQLYYNVM